MSSQDIDFIATFETAIRGAREGPWYGVYNWVLSQIIFHRFCVNRPKQSTATYPQFPLIPYFDTISQDKNEDDMDVNMALDTSTEGQAPEDEDSSEDGSSTVDNVWSEEEIFEEEAEEETSTEVEEPLTPPPGPRLSYTRDGMAPSPPEQSERGSIVIFTYDSISLVGILLTITIPVSPARLLRPVQARFTIDKYNNWPPGRLLLHPVQLEHQLAFVKQSDLPVFQILSSFCMNLTVQEHIWWQHIPCYWWKLKGNHYSQSWG